MPHLVVSVAACGLTGGCIDLGTRPWEPEAPPTVSEQPASSGRAADAPRDRGGERSGGSEGDRTAGDLPVDEVDDAPCPHSGGPVTIDVALDSNAFEPEEVWICAGDTVTWTNFDTKEHTIFTGKPLDPDGRIQSPQLFYGESYSWTFAAPGSFEYYCSTHKKKMNGAWVHVE